MDMSLVGSGIFPRLDCGLCPVSSILREREREKSSDQGITTREGALPFPPFSLDCLGLRAEAVDVAGAEPKDRKRESTL